MIEAKSAAGNVNAVANSKQVARYWHSYRQVLVTTYREFLLVTANSAGEQTTAESFSLAGTEAEFWQAVHQPQALAKEKGEQLVEYLKRVFLQSAQIAMPRDVANLLASYARDARRQVESVGAEKLTGLRRVFQEALGLTSEDERGEHLFRSSLVQTLFYGIFSAWVLWSRRNLPSTKRRFEWRTANWDLKIPVLRKLFSEVAEPGHLNESGLVEILDWAGDTLNRVDRPAFFRTFQETDAVQYFYEPFLEAFDPDLRKQLGVWYTPREIVQYMVARVDRTLREKLGLPDGLADGRVVVLDPCCGTGAFLVEVLHRIVQTLREKGEEALLAHEIKRAAMERIFGFELLTAPFVVAHLQIGAFIQQLGGDFAKDERAGIYLTNALTGWEPLSKPKTFLFPEFKEESDAADHVKRDAQILVILGNPPYNGFAGIAIGEERRLTTAYRDP
ncbi:MAG: N-6 DNA methylase, partial [Bryobacteraceae bacterium]